MPPVNSTVGGAGAGEGAWVKVAGCTGAGAATGLRRSGRCTGRSCKNGDGNLGSIRMRDRVEGQACSERDWAQ